MSGRYAYVVEYFPGSGWTNPPEYHFDVFDVVGSAQRASISIDDSPCVEVQSGLAYLGGWEFRILEVSDPTAPQIVGTYPTSQFVWDIAVDQPYAYLADAAGLSVLDVSDPVSPTLAGSVAMADMAQGLAVNGSYAYVAAGAVGLAIVDVSDPAFPSVVATSVLPGSARDIAIRGSHAYVADGVGLQVVDVSRPAEPRLVGSAGTPGDARHVAVSDARVPNARVRAYVVDRGTGIRVIDVADPTQPVIVNSIVDEPVPEGFDYVRHLRPGYVSVNRGRVAVAGTVWLEFVGGGCGAFTCDSERGYLHVTPPSAYEPLPPCSQPAARMSRAPADAPARGSSPATPNTFDLQEKR